MLELYYKFFDKFCDVNKFEELEMDTDWLYWLKKIYTTVSNQIRELLGKKLGKVTAETLSRRMQNPISSLECVAVRIKNMISGSRDFLKKNLHVQKCYVCEARHIAAMTTSQISSNLAVKDKTSEFSKILETVPCQNTGKCSMKQLILNLLTEDSEL